MALWLALDQVSETERVARQAGRLRPLDGPSGRPTFLHLAGARSLGPWARWQRPPGQAASCRALDFTTRPLRRIPWLVEPSIQTCSRYIGGILLRTEECWLYHLRSYDAMIFLYAESGLLSLYWKELDTFVQAIGMKGNISSFLLEKKNEMKQIILSWSPADKAPTTRKSLAEFLSRSRLESSARSSLQSRTVRP